MWTLLFPKVSKELSYQVALGSNGISEQQFTKKCWGISDGSNKEKPVFEPYDVRLSQFYNISLFTLIILSRKEYN